MKLIAGVDEAGRGPIAGPVVAAAVILSEGVTVEGVRDSKKISENKREKLYSEILERALSVGIGILHEDIIDQINILAATRKAMRMALGRLNPQPEEALIDGYGLPDQIVKNRGIISGDEKIHVISAASIIAKVTRDRMLRMYDIVFPEYKFGKHKGYGTREHLELLEKHLACPIHRRSFHPVKNYLPTLTYIKKNRFIGSWGEKLAATELVHQGYEIITMNYNAAPYGEIDIVARNNQTTVFVEVKSSGQNRWNKPEVKVNYKKISALEKAFEVYINEHEFTGDYRFDLMTVLFSRKKPKITHHVDCLN